MTTAFSWSIADPDGTAMTCRLDYDENGTWDVTVPGCTSQSTRSMTFHSPGARRVTLQVTDASDSSSTTSLVLSVAPPSADTFDITLRFDGTFTTAQRAAFTSAAARWSQVVRGGIPDQAITLGTGSCGDGTPAFSGTVDDVMIDVSIAPIDGPSGVLAQAGPCAVRTASLLPVVGVMQFDSADVAAVQASGLLPVVVLHEMAHVLGFGTLWGPPDLTGAGTASVTFGGPVAVGAWRALSSSPGAVPVENTGGLGTANSHWRESVFGSELMTGYVNSGSNPLSAVTIGSLADLGYTVDLAAADPFGLSGLRTGSPAEALHVVSRLIHPSFAV
jgi:hypothetical protein